MIEYAETLEIYEQNKDDGFLKQALLDIQEKTKLEPNKDNIEFFEIMLSDEKLAEEKKLQSLEKDKQHRLGIEKGKEIGIKEGIELGIQQERERIAKEKEQADREAKRQAKKLNKNKRYIKCNVFIIWKKIKKYYKVIIGSSLVLFILALIGAFGGLPFIVNWLKGF